MKIIPILVATFFLGGGRYCVSLLLAVGVKDNICEQSKLLFPLKLCFSHRFKQYIINLSLLE